MHKIAARLRDTLTATEFRACTEQGKRLDSHQVIDLALDAIARATTAHQTTAGIEIPATSHNFEPTTARPRHST